MGWVTKFVINRIIERNHNYVLIIQAKIYKHSLHLWSAMNWEPPGQTSNWKDALHLVPASGPRISMWISENFCLPIFWYKFSDIHIPEWTISRCPLLRGIFEICPYWILFSWKGPSFRLLHGHSGKLQSKLQEQFCLIKEIIRKFERDIIWNEEYQMRGNFAVYFCDWTSVYKIRQKRLGCVTGFFRIPIQISVNFRDWFT